MPSGAAAQAAARWGPWIAGLLGFAVYAPVFTGSYVWDDLLLIERNFFLRDPARLWDLWTLDLFRGAGLPSATYRPVQAFTYFLEARVSGGSALAHMVSALVHGAAALLLARVLARFASAPIAASAAALWALHPAHTEAVAYVSGRADPLALAFALAAIEAHLSARAAGRSSSRAGLALAAVALLSRESATVLPLWIAASEAARPTTDPASRASWRTSLVAAAPYAVVAAGYLLLRTAVLDLGNSPSTVSMSLSERLLCVPAGLARYAALLAWPMGLHMERSFAVPPGVLRIDVLVGAALAGIVLAGIVRLRVRRPAIAAGLFWFVSAWLPISGLVPLNALLAEHWMYAPSAGLALAGAAAWSERPRPAWAQGLAVAAGVALAAATGSAAAVWRDPVTLYTTIAQRAPWSARVRANLGQFYAERGRDEDALREYEAAIAAAAHAADRPGEFASGGVVGQVRANLCNLYRGKGDLARALEEGRAAVALAPQVAETHQNYGVALLASGRIEDARASFRNALLANPNSSAARSNLGNTYFHEGRLTEALAEYDLAVELEPSLGDAWNNRGSVLFRLGRAAEALESYRRAARLKPESPEIARNLAVAEQASRGAPAAPSGSAAAHVNRGTELANAGQLEEAAKEYRRAIALDPGNAAAHYNLGLIAETRGDPKAAARAFQAALRADPRFDLARTALTRVTTKTGTFGK